MKESPILFSAPMVCAILDGRKTQTRRVVSCANSTVDGSSCTRERFEALDFSEHREKLCADTSYRCGCLKYVPCALDDDPTCGHRVRSRWDAGDQLWVRETWGVADSGGRLIDPCINYRADGAQLPLIGHADPATWSIAGSSHEVNDADLLKVKDGWRSSRFMFRWASRLTLEVIDVRVQRLQEISEEDARAEGVEKLGEFPNITPYRNYEVEQPAGARNFSTAARSFISLWDSINAKRGFRSATNPWVWAISFRIAGSKAA